MSYILPPLRFLLQEVDTINVDQKAAVGSRGGYSDFSKILNATSDAKYLEKQQYV